MSTADTAINITKLIGVAASFGQSALPVARFIAGWFPGAGPVLDAITIAIPIIDRIVAAKPAAEKAIEAGRPVLDALDKASPALMESLKELYAIAVNHDPVRPETNLTADDVSDGEVAAFAGPVLFGRAWTKEEEQRWFDRAQQF